MKSQKERNGGEKNIDFFNFYYICMQNRADYKMEEKALQEIYKEHYRSLCFYASKYVEDMEDAKDIVQNVFVDIWNRPKTFATPMNLKAYLYTTVYNSCMNHLKTRDIHERHHEDIREMSSEIEEHNYVTDRIESEVMWELLSAIDSLPEKCRKVFKLSYMEGLDIKEVAEKLDISPHTVKSQRARAKQLLQERLKDLFPLLAYLFLN